MKWYDINKDGAISYEEFVGGLREELTERRAKMVEKVFNMMDRDRSGEINAKDAIAVFDVSMNPAFIEKKKTREQLVNEYLANFEGAHGN